MCHFCVEVLVARARAHRFSFPHGDRGMRCLKWWLLPPSGFLSAGVMTQAEPASCTTRLYSVNKTSAFGEFPGGPVVKTWPFHCEGPRFNPWSGN